MAIGNSVPLTDQTLVNLAAWFDGRAASVDQGDCQAAEGLRYVCDQGLLSLGISPAVGGAGGSLAEMAEVIGVVSSKCLTSGFVTWCHRMTCEYLASSGNPFLIEQTLPQLLKVERFGATGLANAMKHSVSLEELKVSVDFDGDDLIVNGGIPWSSNLVEDRFVIAVAAAAPSGPPLLIAVPGNAPGVARGSYYSLTALGGTCSASVRFENVRLSRDWVIAWDAPTLLQPIRRVFLTLQSSLAWGLAQAALDNAIPRIAGPRATLRTQAERLESELGRLRSEVRSLIEAEPWSDRERYRALLARKQLTELAIEAVWLELEAMGGAGFMASSGTARRLREAAFLPVQSPSLVQLRIELEQTGAQLERGVQ